MGIPATYCDCCRLDAAVIAAMRSKQVLDLIMILEMAIHETMPRSEDECFLDGAWSVGWIEIKKE